MAGKFGPTFGDEIIAAGLSGLPLSWDMVAGTVEGRDQLTPQQQATLDTVIAAHVPTALPAKKIRDATFEADPAQRDLLTRLQRATPAEIDDWVNANVTSLAAARNVMAAILKVLALTV